ncbi:S-layer homology domain-containing protein, partial [Agathobaculum sp. TL06]
IDDSAYENNSSKMTDISTHWAKGYIKFCESQGIIAGYGDNTFKPDATVTGVEAAKMLLVLSGYDADKAGLVGHDWSTNTLRYAGSAGILDDVNAGLEQGLPRQYAAQMIYNTLDTNRVKWSEDSKSFDDVLNGGIKETVGKAYMKLYSSVGTLVDVDRDTIALTNIDGAESDPVSSKTVSGNVVYTYGTDFTKVATDYSSLLGQKVKVMFKDGKTNDVLGVYALSDNTVYTVNANEVEPDGAKVKFGGKSYSLKTDAIDHTATSNTKTVNDAVKVYITEFDGDKTAYVEDDEVKKSSYFEDLDQSSDVMTFIDSDADGKLDTVIVTDYTAAKVTYASSSQIVAGGETYKFADEKIDEDIAKDDWAVISYDRYNDCKTIVKADKITGKLTATKEGTLSDKSKFDQYKIDDTWYNAAKDGDNAPDLKTVKAGDSVEAVAVNGVLYYVKRTSAGSNGEISDVAMILGTDKVVGTNKASIALFDGTKKTVDIDSDTTAAMTPGEVYEFSVSGDEYTFTALNTNDKDYYGDFTAYDTGINDVKNQKNESITISGSTYKIADSAKVMLYADGDRKYITGKQFKNLTLDNDANTKATAVFVGDMDGLTRVGALAVKVKNLDNYKNLDTNDNYAYILDRAVNSGNNQISYPIWTGSEMIEVTEDYTGSLTNRQAGLVIGYKSIDTANNNKISDVSLKKMGVANIESKSDNDKTLNVTKQPGTSFADNSAAYGEHDIVDDTTVIYVNSDNDYSANAEGGNIGIMNGSPITSDYASVLFLLNGDDFEVIVIDVKGKFVDNPYVVDTAAQSLTADSDVAKTFSTSDQTVSSQTLTAKNIDTKDAAKDVTVTTSNANITVLDSSGNTIDNNTHKLTIVKGDNKVTYQIKIAANTPVGEYTVKFTCGDAEATVNVTVSDATATLTALADSNVDVTTVTNAAIPSLDSLAATATGTGVGTIESDKKWYLVSNGNEMDSNVSYKANTQIAFKVVISAADNYTLTGVSAPATISLASSSSANLVTTGPLVSSYDATTDTLTAYYYVTITA